MTDRIENPMFLYCRACHAADRPVSYDVATNGIVIQVWCQTCDREVHTLLLRDQFQRERAELRALDTGGNGDPCN